MANPKRHAPMMITSFLVISLTYMQTCGHPASYAKSSAKRIPGFQRIPNMAQGNVKNHASNEPSAIFRSSPLTRARNELISGETLRGQTGAILARFVLFTRSRREPLAAALALELVRVHAQEIGGRVLKSAMRTLPSELRQAIPGFSGHSGWAADIPCCNPP